MRLLVIAGLKRPSPHTGTYRPSFFFSSGSFVPAGTMPQKVSASSVED